MPTLGKFLTLPFSKADLEEQQKNNAQKAFLGGLYHVSEGYIYNPGLHGYALHAGIDRYVPYGTNIYAPCNGYIMSSFGFQRAYDDQGCIKQHNWKNVSYGLGITTQIYHPPSGLFILFGHLSSLSPSIPFTPPKLMEDEYQKSMWSASGFALTEEVRERIYDCSWIKPIRRGDYIGTVGLTGLHIDNTFPDTPPNPYFFIEQQESNYTLPHLHMNVFSRDANGKKQTPIDPYDIYDTSDKYPSPFNPNAKLGENHLFILNKQEIEYSIIF